MVLIDMNKPNYCGECRFCEYEQGYCTAFPVNEWHRVNDMKECPLVEYKGLNINIENRSICEYSNFDSEGCWCSLLKKFVDCIGGIKEKCEHYEEE